MLQRFFNFWAKNATRDEQLIAAAEKNDARAVSRLLKEGASVNAGRSHSKGAALIRAAQNGALDAVKILVEAGARVNARNYNRRNAFHEAVVAGQVETALYLLDKSRLTTRDRMKQTSVESAIAGGQKTIVLAMLAAGADMQRENKKGDSAEELVRRAGWTDDAWQDVHAQIVSAREAKEAAGKARLAAAEKYAAELSDAIHSAAGAGRELEAPAQTRFKKAQKPAFFAF